MRGAWLAAALLGALAVLLSVAGGATAAGITNSGGDLRDGWYANQPRLSPDAVASSTFGQLWDAPVDGQVYAQPLVTGSTVVVATERNQVYALDAETGAQKWSRNLGTPFPYTLIGWGCSDLTPDLGVTSTPVIDTATNTIYLTHKTYAPSSSTRAAYYLDALDASTGAQRAGYPKRLTGTAQNAPGVTFDATYELQRPGLLLMDGVVYAAFGGHCDITPYQGWVFGVAASTATIKARWSTVTSGSGAGIWQSGAGLMSDRSGRLYVSTGNGGSPTPPLAAPGNGNYGESIVRLDVQGDGTLKAGDFFAPSDAAHLDDYDADFASGGVTALRDDVFGTSAHPHVGVAVGKAGYVYLLDRDDLGGIGQGTGQGDRVLRRVGPYGGVWSRPGVWPGDGGWIAIPTASPAAGQSPQSWGSAGKLMLYRYRPGTGTPSLDAPVVSDDDFGFSSGAPVITSDGTTSGSAVLWIEWASGGSGQDAQLRAYDAVPVNGHLRLRRSFPIGQSAKFATPGIGAGRVYVGTRDGHVRAFGAPVTASVSGPATTFPLTTVGTTSSAAVKLTIAGAVHISSVTASPSAFAARTAGTGVPGDAVDGQTVTVPVDFTPTQPGVLGGTLTVATDKGTFTFSLTGTAQGTDPQLTVSPPAVSFGGAIVGQELAGTVTLGNAGGRALTISSVTLPGAPFSVDDPPAAGTTIAPGDAINLAVHFRPTAAGNFADDLTVASDGGTKTIGVTGSAGLGPKLVLTPGDGWTFGAVPIGQSKTVALTVANTGDSPMSITKSKPPTSGPFTVLDPLDEGSAIEAGGSRTIRVRFTPTDRGAASAVWMLNAADGSGVHELALTGTGLAPGQLTAPSAATVPDTVLGDTGTTAVTFTNGGDLPLTVDGFDAPGGAFATTDAPADGTVLAAGASRTLHVTFAAQAPGAAHSAMTLYTSGGDATVALSATAVTSGALAIEPTDGWAFGDVELGRSAIASVAVRNTGDTPLRVLDAAPPADAHFTVLDGLPAGTVLAPGEARSVRVQFTPTAVGAVSDVWRIATTAESGSRLIALNGSGIVTPVAPPAPPPVLVEPVPAPPAIVPADLVPPAPIAPPVAGTRGQGTATTPVKARPDVRVTTVRATKDGRRLLVAGRVAKGARGPVAVSVRVRAGRRTFAIEADGVLKGASTFRYTLALPPAARRWSRVTVAVRFAGSATLWPGTGSMVLVHAR